MKSYNHTNNTYDTYNKKANAAHCFLYVSYVLYINTMIYNFAGKGIAVTDEITGYATRRFEHLERLLGKQKVEPLLQCEFELHSGEVTAPYTVKCSLDIAGDLLHAGETGATLHEAIDAAAKALVHEAEKVKGRRLSIRRYASKAKDFLRGFRS